MDNSMLKLPFNNAITCLKALAQSRLLLKVTVIAALLLIRVDLYAQEATQDSDQAPLTLSVTSDGSVSQTGEVLRLEETIRGNKEQPKVLSIVPWQLPLHQRIDRNEKRWVPLKIQLKSMERSSFLKEIKLIDSMRADVSGTELETKSN